MSSNIEINRICEECGKPFTARTTTTRYCSHKCNSRAYKARIRNEKIKAVKTDIAEVVKLDYDALRLKPYLTISEAAKLLGVCRKTMYNYLYNNKIKAIRLSQRKTLIRNEDINKLFEEAQPYEQLSNNEQVPITEFYTIDEVIEKYNVKYRRIHDIVKQRKIPHQLKRNRLYISKNHIDKYFSVKKEEETNDAANVEWLSISDVCKIYNITREKAYYYISFHNVPKRKDGRFVYVPKNKFDEILTPEPL